jgi:hypothetical protein
VVPASFIAYFAAVTGAAAALIGLLFVSVSLRPDTVFGTDAPRRGKALAATAFTGLVNTFFLSLIALIPATNLGYPAVVLSGISLTATARLQLQLSHSGPQLILMVLSAAAYLLQCGVGIYLIGTPRNSGAFTDIAYAMIASLAVALGRAWALLQGKHITGPAEVASAKQI